MLQNRERSLGLGRTQGRDGPGTVQEKEQGTGQKKEQVTQQGTEQRTEQRTEKGPEQGSEPGDIAQSKTCCLYIVRII